MTTVEDLTPAALTPESLARVHALWSWTYRLDVIQLQAAMGRLTPRELRDVDLAAQMLRSYVKVELLRRVADGLESKVAVAPAYRVARCGQTSVHAPHVVDHGPDQPRNCPGYAPARVGAS